MLFVKNIKCSDQYEIDITALNEICFLKSLNIKSIPKMNNLIKYNNEEKTIRFYQEYKGESLASWLKKTSYNKRLKLLPSIITQISRILLYLHKLNIIHMDLKLDNICIDDDNNIFVIDFGLSSFQTIDCGIKYGTPSYENPVDNSIVALPCKDIYAFGLVIYLILVGRRFWNVEDMNKCFDYDSIFKLLEIDNIETIPKYYASIIKDCLKGDITAKQLYKTFDNSNYPRFELSIPPNEELLVELKHNDVRKNIELIDFMPDLDDNMILKTLFTKWMNVSSSYWTEKSLKYKIIACYYAIRKIIYHDYINPLSLINKYKLKISCKEFLILAWGFLHEIDYQIIIPEICKTFKI